MKIIRTDTAQGFPKLGGRFVEVEIESGADGEYLTYYYPIMHGSCRDIRRTMPKKQYGKIVSQTATEIVFEVCSKRERDIAVGKQIIFNQCLEELKAQGIIEESADGSMIRLRGSCGPDGQRSCGPDGQHQERQAWLALISPGHIRAATTTAAAKRQKVLRSESGQSR